MDLAGWNRRYQSGERAREDLLAPPAPLLVNFAQQLPVGAALDLACGSGRHSLWLAGRGWTVTAVDGAHSAIKILRQQAAESGLEIDAVVADLEHGEFAIQESSWDLILMAYYLQRDLFQSVKAGVKPGGLVIAIVHITDLGEEPAPYRAAPGELADFFKGWNILHYYEGPPNDEAHRRLVAELVARLDYATST